jgi:hypothetical protein
MRRRRKHNDGANVMTRICPTCTKPITGHPNKKFCDSRCKDRHHNKQPGRATKARQFAPAKLANSLLGMIERKRQMSRIQMVRTDADEDHGQDCDCYACLMTGEDDY